MGPRQLLKRVKDEKLQVAFLGMGLLGLVRIAYREWYEIRRNRRKEKEQRQQLQDENNKDEKKKKGPGNQVLK